MRWRDALATLLDGATRCAGWPLTRGAGDDELARLWQVTPPPGSSRLADLRGGLRAALPALVGGRPPPAGRSSADWQPTRPFLAAALPQALLARWQQVAARAAAAW